MDKSILIKGVSLLAIVVFQIVFWIGARKAKSNNPTSITLLSARNLCLLVFVNSFVVKIQSEFGELGIVCMMISILISILFLVVLHEIIGIMKLLKNVPQQTDEHYESTLKKAEKTKKLVLQTYFIHLFLCVTFLFFFE